MLLEKVNDRLIKALIATRRHNARLEGKDPQLVIDELMIELAEWEKERIELEAALAEERARVEPEEEPTGPVEHKPSRGHGPREQPRLRRVERLFELPEDERSCTLCGGVLEEMMGQFEESEMVDVIRLQYVMTQVRRKKYRCRCNGCVKTAPGPQRAIPGGRYSLDFALHVAEDKYLDHLPLERQVRRMARTDLEVTSQTLFDQIEAMIPTLRPTYDALERLLLDEPVMHADETRWPRLDGKGLSNWTVWGRCAPRVAHYAILGSRSEKAARKLFRNYQGVVVADGYAVYEALVRGSPGMQLANCWAHVLRKFTDIEENFPRECRAIIKKIRALYAIEAKVPGIFPGDAETQRVRLRLRETESRPLLAELRNWAMTTIGLPQSALGKAVRYMLNRWDALTLFLENPLVPLDNNAAERALRGHPRARHRHPILGSRRLLRCEVIVLARAQDHRCDWRITSFCHTLFDRTVVKDSIPLTAPRTRRRRNAARKWRRSCQANRIGELVGVEMFVTHVT